MKTIKELCIERALKLSRQAEHLKGWAEWQGNEEEQEQDDNHKPWTQEQADFMSDLLGEMKALLDMADIFDESI